MVQKKVAAAEKKLNVTFKDKNLLKVALTHSSFAYETGVAEFNEKLEFLGDSVLSIVVTEFIFRRYPKLTEGDLAKLRASLVRTETLAEVARELGIGHYVLISKGAEQAGGRENDSILADCLEAIIGSIYLDQGYEIVKDFILTAMEEKILTQAAKKELADPKTNLQELTMERWGVLPEYRIVSQEGPAHNPVFSARVFIGGKKFGSGMGRSKKKAEQIAAVEALKEISKLEV